MKNRMELRIDNIKAVIGYLERLRDEGEVPGLKMAEDDFSSRLFIFDQSTAWTPILWETANGDAQGISVDGICSMMNWDTPMAAEHTEDIKDWLGVDEENASAIFIPPAPMSWYSPQDAIDMLNGLMKDGVAVWPEVEQPENDPDFQTGMEIPFEEVEDDDDEEEF